MAYRKRNNNMKKRVAKRRYVRRKRVFGKKRPVPRGIGGIGFPKQQMVSMRYCANISLSGAAGAMVKYLFRANSPYLPDKTANAGLAKGYTEWGAFYHKFCVVGAKISVYNADSALTQAYPVMTFIKTLSADQTAPTDYIEIFEQGKVKQSILNGNFARPTTTRGFYSMKKFWSIKDVKDNFDTYGSHFGSVPVEEAYFYVCLQSLDKLRTIANALLVCIDYAVLLSEPRPLA